jgi:hypothetical protein
MSRVVVSRGLGPAVAGRIVDLVGEGLGRAAGDHAAAVEIHVRAARPQRAWRVRLAGGRTRSFARRKDAVAFRDRHGGELTAHDRVRHTWITGRAYDGVPSIARVATGIRYLVTLRVPVDRDGLPSGRYPRVWRYARYATAPSERFADWQEEVVHAAAHEGRHVVQFATGLSRSEIDAEHAACAVLAQWRRERSDPGQLALF